VVGWAVARARRQLRRVARLATDDRLVEAVVLAEQARTTLRRQAAVGRCARHEYTAALVTVADLHRAAVNLPAALETLDELVALLEISGGQESEDRLADALTRRGDTLRLQARYDEAGSTWTGRSASAARRCSWLGRTTPAGSWRRTPGGTTRLRGTTAGRSSLLSRSTDRARRRWRA
jgi:hypothetical protein